MLSIACSSVEPLAIQCVGLFCCFLRQQMYGLARAQTNITA